MSDIQPPDFASYFHTFRVYPDRAQMEQNATVFAAYLGALGFTINSACAMLGNWESECRLNPNYPTSANFPTTRSGGFGLPQWTPWGRKIGDWALTNLGISPTATDDNPLSAIDVQMLFHEYSATTGRDWYSNEGFNYTWPGFKKSTDDPRTLAEAYYWQYERSSAQGPGSRGEQAAAWYEFFGGVLPPYPSKIPVWLLYKFKRGLF